MAVATRSHERLSTPSHWDQTTVTELLEQAAGDLVLACRTDSAGQRYTAAHRAAVRSAAAVVAALVHPRSRAGVLGTVTVWELLPVLAPDLAEWAGFLASASRRVRAWGDHRLGISPRDADDLVRQAQQFHVQVCARLRHGGEGAPALLSPLVRP